MPSTWSRSALASRTASIAVPRIRPVVCRAGKELICARISGNAPIKNQWRPSALIAIEVWVRAVARAEPNALHGSYGNCSSTAGNRPRPRYRAISRAWRKEPCTGMASPAQGAALRQLGPDRDWSWFLALHPWRGTARATRLSLCRRSLATRDAIGDGTENARETIRTFRPCVGRALAIQVDFFEDRLVPWSHHVGSRLLRRLFVRVEECTVDSLTG